MVGRRADLCARRQRARPRDAPDGGKPALNAQGPAAASVIEARGLYRRFGDKVAVADLTLTVGRGEVFGFLGPNGAGKTTSLKMLLGLIPPTAGQAFVLGRPLGDRSARAKIGFLPEHFRFHDWMTGREMLRFHGRLFGLSGAPLERRIEELLRRVDLQDAASRRLSGYSKGMLQRVGLAQALLARPDLVFLDEPTSGLDPLGRLLVRDIIREMRADGTSVFLNSHLLGEVEATCDRVAFVKHGRILSERRLDAVPETAAIDLRVGSTPPALLTSLASLGTVHRHGSDGVLRVDVADPSVAPALARAVVEAGVDLWSLTVRRPSLEEVFLSVMGDDSRPG